ncbi:hypothetical protein JYB88_01755 [Shewanella cyperi]|uniref:Uncharacterized protein n=1 Tax=Shewanella cyperi TaxID=2814292 RepID=A0A975ALN0_9GAMM|nr:hypothetical protein [Shewanella cyperi]QSX30408.1 hypothetical protein JYB88_01755 [Shewanella cyperi]
MEKDNKKDFSNYLADSSTLISFALAFIALIVPTFRGDDFFKRLISFDIDGLMIYQSIFVILSSTCAFVIFYTINRLLSVSKVRSKLKKYGYYTLTLLAISSMSFCLREVYAPSNSMSSLFLNEDGRIIYSKIQTEAGVEFEVISCNGSGSQVTCEIQLRNISDEDVEIYGLKNSIAYNENNIKSSIERVTLENNKLSNSTFLMTKLSTSNVKLFFSFDTAAISKSIKKLTLPLNYTANDRKVIFRNVDIQR